MYGTFVVSTRRHDAQPGMPWFEVGTFATQDEAESVAAGHRFHHDVEAVVHPYED